ncbi:hypothetical protein HYFRA_00003716 [Hymenoscyphus fraxineus]|uniref:DJ-1/PfpI domain-containing protein n=1 Tax=Hymenoscyphus fraxineus TaxID=746836 RepID=A0A9N9KYI6_9HELO|nr:hypothetical protein HYFRA_00003716 [Hymenoscyphus fraxineus]
MTPLKFGILMIPYQTMDVAGPLDILSNASKQFLGSPNMKELLQVEYDMEPEGKERESYINIGDRGIDIEFLHIGFSMEPVALTAGFSANPTTTVKECPPLDYLLVGGPDPALQLHPEFAKFVKEHVAAGKGLFCTCTGAFAIATTGVLDGKKATTNHVVLPSAKKLFPKIHWVEEQWAIDGNIWTAGGACAGMDMFAEWVRKHCDADVAAVANRMLDFHPRGLDKKLIV